MCSPTSKLRRELVRVTVEVQLVETIGPGAELNLYPCPILAFRLSPNTRSIWLVFLEGWPPS